MPFDGINVSLLVNSSGDPAAPSNACRRSAIGVDLTDPTSETLLISPAPALSAWSDLELDSDERSSQ